MSNTKPIQPNVGVCPAKVMPHLMLAHIKNCARCGHDHPGLLFRQLKRVGQALGSEWSHWASCPETGEPIMLAVVDDEKRKPGEPPLF